MISYREEDGTLREPDYYSVGEEADNQATISHLLACTNYTFFVSGVSASGAQGSTETTEAMMDETGEILILTLGLHCSVKGKPWGFYT